VDQRPLRRGVKRGRDKEKFERTNTPKKELKDGCEKANVTPGGEIPSLDEGQGKKNKQSREKSKIRRLPATGTTWGSISKKGQEKKQKKLGKGLKGRPTAVNFRDGGEERGLSRYSGGITMAGWIVGQN